MSRIQGQIYPCRPVDHDDGHPRDTDPGRRWRDSSESRSAHSSHSHDNRSQKRSSRRCVTDWNTRQTSKTEELPYSDYEDSQETIRRYFPLKLLVGCI